MELQDKLHHNVCRGRSLVSMGTHDLDSVKGPFYYRALKPEEIKFRMLNRSEETVGTELLSVLDQDPKLKYYTHLLKNEPLYPVVMDSQGIIMALPPMINSEHSKIKTTTKNVIIDITAKDLTKAKIVLNTLVAMFSMYCDDKFTIEQVEVVTPSGKSINYPDISTKTFDCEPDYLTRVAGISVDKPEIVKLLNKMALKSHITEDGLIRVEVPITRSDIIHACDIAEDLAISYGFNNIQKCKPQTVCNGYQQPINKLTDLIRLELSFAGYIESLTMTLLSKNDMFTNMLREINEENLSKTVQIYKSKTTEFEVFRTSLIPGILKTINANQTNQLPYKVFEISDNVHIDDNHETGATNRRSLCFAYANHTSGIEQIHGIIDHIMHKLGLVYEDRSNGYYIQPSFERTFLEDRQAHLYVRGIKAGVIYH
jgi:phenylalanyl-tRNA synthetase beta chain